MNVTQNPGARTAKRILNMHTHKRKGALTSIPLYDLKYSAPTHDTIINQGYLGFHNFYDRSADPDGREISVLVHGAEIQSIISIYTDVINAPCFWVRPYWDVDTQSWVDEWKWLNEIIITKLSTGSGSPAQNMVKILGGTDPDYGGIAEDSLVGWTIVHQAKGDIAQIISNKDEGSGATTRICHTLFNSDWSMNDVVILMKNYIPLDYMEGMYNADWRDISFHTVLNDLRIGFGGKEDRLGIGIGFRDKYFKMSEFDFTSVHADLTSSALTAFSKLEGLTLNPYTFIPQSAYGIDLVETAGTLAQGAYYFKLTGILDNYAELLLVESEIAVDGTKDIEAYPYLRLGEHNKRITGFRLWASTTKLGSYRLIKTYQLTSDEATASEWEVNDDGFLYLEEAVPELHKESNAASVDNDANDAGSWEKYPADTTHLTVSVETSGTPPSTYYLRCTPDSATILWGSEKLPGLSFPLTGLMKETDYTITFQAKAQNGTPTVYVFFIGDNNIITLQPITKQAITTSWAEYTITVDSGDSWDMPKKIVFAIPNLELPQYLEIDDVSVKEVNGSKLTPTTELKESIVGRLGYNPTFNIVKSWDQCLRFNNKCHYLNPYIEKRYENWIMKSIISGSNGNMYDAVTTASYNELGNTGSNKVVAISKLSNDNLLVHGNVTAFIFDPDSNITIYEYTGKGCVSKWSVVNIDGNIFWASLEDTHAFINGAVKDLMKDNIRALYEAKGGKNGIVGTRDEYNTYRVRIYDITEKTEYLLTENGWIEEAKEDFAFQYAVGYNYQLWFIDLSGNVYLVRGEIDSLPVDEIVIDEDTLIVED